MKKSNLARVNIGSIQPVAAALALAGALSAITCGGDVVVDDDGRGGSGQGASGVGASGNVGNQGSGNAGNQGSGNAGNQGSGNVGNEPGQGGTGTLPDCITCAVAITCLQEDAPGPECSLPLCQRSGVLYDALIGCICTACAVPCAMTCQGAPDPMEPDCAACGLDAAMNACNMQFGSCAGDA